MDERKLVNTSQAAEALNVHPSTLWRWEKKGEIKPAWRTPGGQARWDLDDLRRQLKIGQPEGSDPVVAAIVTSERGVLISRRIDGMPPWGFISGKIEAGESPRDAAIREVKEETGLEVRAAEREIDWRVHPKTGKTMIYWACRPVGDLDVHVGDEAELAEVRWVSLTEAQELLPGMFEPVLEHLRAELGD